LRLIATKVKRIASGIRRQNKRPHFSMTCQKTISQLTRPSKRVCCVWAPCTRTPFSAELVASSSVSRCERLSRAVPSPSPHTTTATSSTRRAIVPRTVQWPRRMFPRPATQLTRRQLRLLALLYRDRPRCSSLWSVGPSI
jgi:hypothetical protein